MTTHSSILAWEIPWTKEPGRLQSMGSERVKHDWVTEHTLMPSCCSDWVRSTASLWVHWSFVSSSLLLNPPSLAFSSVILLLSCDFSLVLCYIIYLFGEFLTVFIYSTPKFRKHLCDYHFELCQVLISVSLRFSFEVLCCSFTLNIFFCFFVLLDFLFFSFYVTGKTVIFFPIVEGMALCRR